jgi:hypothetical protein
MFSRYSDLTDWHFEIPATIQTAAWQHSSTHATDWARWNAYLNQICLDTCIAELQAESLPAAIAPADLAPRWAVVNGALFTAHGTRFVLVPTEAVDYTELAVPQEWVDIPSWAADYYLAVQVAVDGRSLHLVGYASHRQLKQTGHYDSRDRTYSIDLDDLTTDLNLLWLSYQRVDEVRAAVGEIAPLPAAQATNLITRLGNPLELLPRLEVPFATWAALLDNSDLCQQLYAQRQGQQAGQRQSGTAHASDLTRLSLWLQGQIEGAWQAAETLLSPVQLGMATRNIPSPTPSAMPYVVINQVKLLTFCTDQIALSLTLARVEETEVRVQVQILPMDQAATLPGETCLRLLAGSPTDPQPVEIGHAQAAITETIQLQFRAQFQETFYLEITCNGHTVTERFAL